MKLHLTTAENNNLITAYGEDYIEVNRIRYAHNLIVAPNEIISPWTSVAFSDLSDADFAAALTLQPEVVLLGTGSKHLFLHPKHYQSLSNQGISLECMTTAAACRTYNILMSEGRTVAAILML
ncbi:MAG: Mth938-like domain-containing protein [Methylotenera sp.]